MQKTRVKSARNGQKCERFRENDTYTHHVIRAKITSRFWILIFEPSSRFCNQADLLASGGFFFSCVETLCGSCGGGGCSGRLVPRISQNTA